MCKRHGKWRYTIRAYYPPNAQFPRIPNALAIETVHAGVGSRDVEILVFRDRMRRGDFSHIEVITHIPPFGTETIYPEGDRP
jgi:hypothetical protein